MKIDFRARTVAKILLTALGSFPLALQGTEWGSVRVSKDRAGHYEAILENSKLRVRYGRIINDKHKPVPAGARAIMRSMEPLDGRDRTCSTPGFISTVLLETWDREHYSGRSSRFP